MNATTDPRARGPLHGVVQHGIAELYPGYFGLVMATGMVSIAAHELGFTALAQALLRINLACYTVLSALLLARVVSYFPRIVRDLQDHWRGPGFFTVVAATCVLGSQLALLTQTLYAAALLWCVAVALWFVLMYGFLAAVTVRAHKPALVAAINGSWLFAIVATQSVSVLGTVIAPIMEPWSAPLLFFTLVMFLVGCLLYVLIITLVFYRLTFFDLDAQSLSPPYWINMGAVAITTLAGATLLLHAEAWPFLGEVRAFLTGITLLAWAIATWWIPLLLLLGAWRHLYHQVPLRYDPHYWGMVFPLGMYAAATYQFSQATGITFIVPIARVFVVLALASWSLAFAGLVYGLYARAREALLLTGVLPAVRTPGGGMNGRRAPVAQPAHWLSREGTLAQLGALHLLCPLHGVEADMLVNRAGAHGFEVQECSLLRQAADSRGPLHCAHQCVSQSWKNTAYTLGGMA